MDRFGLKIIFLGGVQVLYIQEWNRWAEKWSSV